VIDPKGKATSDDLLLEHEYDGIREYDNPMPNWWKWIFWGSFYFTIAYFAHYHLTGNGQSVAESFDAEVAQAREVEAQQLLKGGGPSEEKLLELMGNVGLMADAKQLFVARCAQCHGNNGEGKIGPNLTDTFWLHGDATLMALHSAIANGFPNKGMPPWSRLMSPVQVMKLAAFVGTLRNTNVPGPRGPEGINLNLKP
jgi:cytochrome c oxidase cbb3-type subunit 3